MDVVENKVLLLACLSFMVMFAIQSFSISLWIGFALMWMSMAWGAHKSVL